MTATLDLAGRRIDTAATRNALLARLSTASPNTARGRRVTALLNELGDIAADLRFAAIYDPETNAAWLAELETEERDVWAHLVEALTDRTTGESSDPA